MALGAKIPQGQTADSIRRLNPATANRKITGDGKPYSKYKKSNPGCLLFFIENCKSTADGARDQKINTWPSKNDN
jgi:hypothetical protein